jgi:hypothetical protein
MAGHSLTLAPVFICSVSLRIHFVLVSFGAMQGAACKRDCRQL